MKKLFFVTVSIFLLNFSLSAQDIKFGVVGGANLSNVDYSFDFPNKKPRISYHIGVFTEIPLSPKFNFKPEIVYTSIVEFRRKILFKLWSANRLFTKYCI